MHELRICAPSQALLGAIHAETSPSSADGGRGGPAGSSAFSSISHHSATSRVSGRADLALLRNLGDYVEACGGDRVMISGWRTETELRGAASANSVDRGYDTYFYNPAGKKFRSRAEVARYFKLTPVSGKIAPARAPASAHVGEVAETGDDGHANSAGHASGGVDLATLGDPVEDEKIE